MAKEFFQNLIGSQMLREEISERNFFGFRSLVVNAKSFVILFEDSLVFKLDEKSTANALALNDAEMWNPYGRKKKHWIRLPESQSSRWQQFLIHAIENILKLKGEEK